MDIILLVLHVLLALGIITLVLLQKGKGATEGATFGGGASTVFGASGSSNFLSKTTAILATIFFINSLALAYLAGHREQPTSLLDKIAQPADAPAEVIEQAAPAADAPVDDMLPPADDAAADSSAVDTEIPPPAAE